MKKADYIELKKEISLQMKEKNYVIAQRMILKALEEFPYDTDLLLKKYVCAWFVPSDAFVEDVAKSTLEVAAELSPNSVANQIELGNHYYAVLEDFERAKVCFRKAVDIALQQIRESYLGLMKISIDEYSKEEYQKVKEEISLLSEDVRNYCNINAEIEVLEED
ncbi:MAG: hypothetical protein K6B46_05780 [Opitutales bacterium]|nr:hypothetical protein [Opitutales bacterium]